MHAGQHDNPPGETSIVLKVDVDTKVGLIDGVPRLMDIMQRLGVRASYFIAMGPDNSGRALRRVFRPGFLGKQLKSGAAGAYGPVTMLYGLALPGPIISKTAPNLFNELAALGHEVGLHGWDHVFWHDRVRDLERNRVRSHLGQAWRLFREITSRPPATWASPGWQVSAEALLAFEDMGLTHISCGRGVSPFRPVVRGRALPMIEIPTTMPTFDEVLGRDGVDASNVGQWMADQVRPGRLNVFTMHGEVEGRALAPAFEQMVRLLIDRGVVFETLCDAALKAAAQPDLPCERIVWADVPHRAYQVSAQESVYPSGEPV